MLRGRIRLLLAAAAVAWVVEAGAQADPRGMIIRVADGLVYIDLGQRDGVRNGDLFDIVTSEVLSHPLSGDTLAVSPRSVGAVRVRQVFEKMAIAEVIYLEQGEDPMLMPVTRIDDADRLVQIEEQARLMPSLGSGTPLRLGLVPGLHQLRRGHSLWGTALLALEAGSLTAAILNRISSSDLEERYDAYGIETPFVSEAYLVRLGEDMQERRRWSNRLFWTAGAVYALNWVDVLWSDGRGVSGLPLVLSPGVNRGGAVLVQAAYRF